MTIVAEKSATPVINCPTCDKPASMSTENPSRPFCSERCKLIDLGEWASESHRIAGSEAALSEEVIDPDHGG